MNCAFELMWRHAAVACTRSPPPQPQRRHVQGCNSRALLITEARHELGADHARIALSTEIRGKPCEQGVIVQWTCILPREISTYVCTYMGRLQRVAKHTRQNGGEDHTVQPRVISGGSTVGSFSNYPEWGGSACTSGGRDKDDFLRDAGERYRLISFARPRGFIIIIRSPRILFCIFTNSSPLRRRVS